MWDIIRRDNTRRTIIFSSHNFERSLAVCHEVMVLQKGKIAFSDKSCNLTLELLREAYHAGGAA
jgi:ABC-type multidrug transport system ATPase subunit